MRRRPGAEGEPIYAPPPARIAPGADAAQTLLTLLGSYNIASKRWAYEQYDTLVGSRTATRAGAGDCAVLSLDPDGGEGAIAVAIDGNGRRVPADPYACAVGAALECAQTLACAGAEPDGLTDRLSFGNPEKADTAGQFVQAVEGIAA